MATLDPVSLRKQVERQLARQRALVKELLALRDQVQGSVFARYGTCGKQNCGCSTGKGHGPYTVLSTRGGGRASFVYLRRDQARAARQLVAAGRSYRQGMSQLKAINDSLIDLMRRYQRAVAKAAGRRLGIEAA